MARTPALLATLGTVVLLTMSAVAPGLMANATIGPLAVDLGSAASFAVLSGSLGITSTTSTVVTGDVGSTGAIGGFPPGTVSAPWNDHNADSVTVSARADLAAAPQRGLWPADHRHGCR